MSEQEQPKPPIENMPGEEGVAPPSDEEESDVIETDVLEPDAADADDTVDNKEQPEEEQS